jgi:hypothetical protein
MWLPPPLRRMTFSEATGAGIRFLRAGTCGAGLARRTVGLRTTPAPDRCATPRRARPSLENPRTQAATKTATTARFIVVIPRPACLLSPSPRSTNKKGPGIAAARIISRYGLSCFSPSPVVEVLIVAKATTACGRWTVRVGHWGGARNAAANRAAALRARGWRGIGWRRVGWRRRAILCIYRLHPNCRSNNAYA